MNWRRTLGASLVAAGTLLCGVYVVPTVYGSAMAHIAVAEFRAQSPANRLWDSARVRAYQRSLTASFSAPEAILRVPRVGIEVPVLEGTSDLTLNRGVGHIAGTALPGHAGNIAISGHRDGFFRALKDVVPGDRIEVQRGPSSGETDHYVVRSMKVVLPSDTSVLTASTESMLTLVTCYPFYFIGSAPQRYIVQATLLDAARVAPELLNATPSHLVSQALPGEQ